MLTSSVQRSNLGAFVFPETKIDCARFADIVSVSSEARSDFSDYSSSLVVLDKDLNFLAFFDSLPSKSSLGDLAVNKNKQVFIFDFCVATGDNRWLFLCDPTEQLVHKDRDISIIKAAKDWRSALFLKI